MTRHAAVFLALLLALAETGCGRSDGNEIQASGQIEATEVRVATKVSGTLESVRVEEGDRVEVGRVLAVVDTTDLEIERRAVLAERDQARAGLDLLLAGSRREDIVAARAEVARREADLRGAQLDFDRMQALLDRGAVAEKLRDDARVRRDMAQAARLAAIETLRKLERGARPQEVASARAGLAGSDARLDAIEQQIRDSRITAPIAGVVTEKLLETGELVTVGAGIVVISDIDRPWLTVFVDGPDVARVRVGDRARVTTDDPHGIVREGRVSYVASTAEFTPRNAQTRDERAKLVYRVKIRLDNPDGTLKPGMPADARIVPTPRPIAGRAKA